MLVLRLVLAVVMFLAPTHADDTPGTVPESVAAYRKELEDPDKLADEILRSRRVKDRSNANPLADIAFSAMRNEADLEKILADGIHALEAESKAALEKRQASQPGADAQRAEAKLWERLARLNNAAGSHSAGLDASLRRMECIVGIATPEEWLGGSLDAIAAYQRAGKEAKATEWLERCKKLVAEEPTLRDSPAAKARLELAELRTASSPSAALIELAPAVEKALGASAPETISCIEDVFISALQTNSNLIDPGNRLIAAYETVCGPTHPATIRATALVGNALFAKGRRGEAYPFARRALDGWIAGAGLGVEGRLVLGRRVAVYERENDLNEQAEKSSHALIAASIKLRGEEDRETLWLRNDLAIVMSSLGDHAGSEKLNRELLEIRKRAFGPEDADTLSSMNNIGVQFAFLGRYRDAEKLYRETLTLREKVSGSSHAETLRTKSNLGEVLCILGDYDAAEKIHKEVYDVRAVKLGEENSDTLSSKYELASVAFGRGDLAAAEKLADELIAARERTSGVDHSYTLAAIELLANILTEKGEPARAIANLNRVLTEREKRGKKDDPSVVDVKFSLGQAELAADDVASAEPLLREAVDSFTRHLGAEHFTSARATMSLGKLLARKKDFAGAEPLFRMALKNGEAALGPQHPFAAECACLLAETLEARGSHDEARTLAASAAAIAAKKLDPKSPLRERCRKLKEKLGPPPR